MKRTTHLFILLLLTFFPFTSSAQRAFYVNLKGMTDPLLFIGEQTDSIVIIDNGESGATHTVYSNKKEYSHPLSLVDSLTIDPQYFLINGVDRNQHMLINADGEKYAILDKQEKEFNIYIYTNLHEKMIVDPSSECDWFTATTVDWNYSCVVVNMLENNTNKVRQQKVKLSLKGYPHLKDSIILIQQPHEILSFEPKLYYKDNTAQEFILPYAVFGEHPEGEIKYDSGCDWVTIQKKSRWVDDDFYYYYATLSENNTNAKRETNVIFTDNITSDTIKIVQFHDKFWGEDSKSSANDDYYSMFFLDNTEQNISFQFNGELGIKFDNQDIENENHWIRLISAKDNMLTFHIDANNTNEHREFSCNFFLGDVTQKSFTFIQVNKNEPSIEQIEQALIDLYNATGGDNWGRKENWLSDKPYWQWQGINDSGVQYPAKFYLSNVNLSGNNLTGELPESSAHLISVAPSFRQEFNIDDNILYGKIPEAMYKHPNWQEFGWRAIKQDIWRGGGFSNIEDSKLLIHDEPIEFLFGNSTTHHELLNKNKYTIVTSQSLADTDNYDYPISDKLANLFLDYKNKGLGIIHNYNTYYEPLQKSLQNFLKGYPLDVAFTLNGFQLDGFSINGSYFIFDSNGYVVEYLPRNYGFSEDYYIDRIQKILQAKLGDPEEHDPYTQDYYTSTDYSRDGEVVTMQKASVGKGIDLVFMGDAYVDTAMVAGGQYEIDMARAMETFFDVEPYKSFRNRFNVYAVKVVSPNSHYADGYQHAINGDDNICFEYAKKIENINLDNVTIVNVENNYSSYFLSGHANMYDSGASVAHIEIGGVSDIIVHEAGGHGFAKLLDEYIYSGYEYYVVPEDEKDEFQSSFKAKYHNKGWGLNVDITYDPYKVVWKHFLNDDRYANEVGIYQGAWFYPADLWRASENSVMNRDYTRFNAPSREIIYKRIMQLSEGDEWTYDYNAFAEWDSINRATSTQSSQNSIVKMPETQKDDIISNDQTCYFLYKDKKYKLGDKKQLNKIIEHKSPTHVNGKPLEKGTKRTVLSPSNIIKMQY